MVLTTLVTAPLFGLGMWATAPFYGEDRGGWANVVWLAVIFAPLFLGGLAWQRRGQLQDEEYVRGQAQQNDG